MIETSTEKHERSYEEALSELTDKIISFTADELD